VAQPPQFIGIAAHMMRRILVDHARAKQATKRGEMARVELDEAIESSGGRPWRSWPSTTFSVSSPNSTSGSPASWNFAFSAA
jgi:hypothetical protein